MKRKTYKRLFIGYVFSVWLMLTLNYALPRLLPGDPLAALLDPSSSAYVFDPTTRTALEAYYGLDAPPLEQYARYLWGIVTGDMGRSIRLNQPVSVVLRDHLPYTLLLTLTAMSAAAILGVWGGAWAAWRRGSRWDSALVTLSVVVSNIPVFLIGMALLMLFGVALDWFPLAGGRTAFARYPTLLDAVWDHAAHLFLPALTLTLGMLGSQFLLVRGSMLSVLSQDYLLVARAKGLTPRRIRNHHALRNALIPFVHHMAAHAAFALTGALFIETLFGYPGMGRLIFESVSARDYPMLQGVFVYVALLVISANLLADWLTLRLDPRLREAA